MPINFNACSIVTKYVLFHDVLTNVELRLSTQIASAIRPCD